jgi:hypothetical protein
MRRTMHAFFGLLILSSLAMAEETKQKLTSTIHAPVAASGNSLIVGDNSSPEFYPIGASQPYSQLATRMACNDACKDFWAGYAGQRAALASQLCEGCQSGCGGCGATLHSSAHAAGGCATGDCGSAAGAGGARHGHHRQRVQPIDLGPLNNSRPAWSSLYETPAPGMGCSTGNCGRGHGRGRGHHSISSGAPAPCGEGCGTGACSDGGCGNTMVAPSAAPGCATGACAATAAPQSNLLPIGNQHAKQAASPYIPPLGPPARR